MRKTCTKYSFFILLGLATVAGAQQTIPPFTTPYGNFTLGIQLGGSYGTASQCIVSTGSGAHWGACTTAGVSSITGAGGTEAGALTFTGPGVTNVGTTFTFALGINQLTGDATAGPGSGSQAITFATVNSGPGSCGDSTHVCQVTTNGKGLVTAQTAVSVAASGINQLTGDATAGPGTGSQALTLATVNSGPGSCGDSTHVCQVTTNGKGLVTAQTPTSINFTSGFTSGSNANGFWEKDPAGFIENWQQLESVSGDTAVTFPTAYTSTSGLVITYGSNFPSGDTGYCSTVLGSVTTTGFTIHPNNVTPETCDWFAKGH